MFFSSPVEADTAVANLAGRLFFNGRIMKAQTWDGKTKYRVEETEEEERERLAKWDKFLEGQGEGEEEGEGESKAGEQKKEEKSG